MVFHNINELFKKMHILYDLKNALSFMLLLKDMIFAASASIFVKKFTKVCNLID